MGLPNAEGWALLLAWQRQASCLGKGLGPTHSAAFSWCPQAASLPAGRSSDEAGALGEGLGLDTAPPGASFGAAWAAMEQHTGMGRYRIAGAVQALKAEACWCWVLTLGGARKQHTGMGR